MNQEEMSGRIAIVGMSGRFPGADTIEEYWRNLCAGVESISSFTDEDLVASGVPDEIWQHRDYVARRGVLSDITQFDAGFFGLSEQEARLMDPQQRLFLECAWSALEDAGYDSEQVEGPIGVFAGSSLSCYLLNNLIPNSGAPATLASMHTRISNDKDYLPAITSFKLNLRGPSIGVQTGSSTSLVAVSLACQSLLTYECDMALAGAVSLAVPNRAGYSAQHGLFSSDGHCRAFDAAADGTVAGEGLGIVVLKRLEDATATDTIRAVIRGAAINNDGAAKATFSAPSASAQSEVIARAQSIAGVTPDTIDYIEAHGTGIPPEDSVEIKALTDAFHLRTTRRNFCAIGSVKANIGHLDTAAGIAGLIKTVAALQHQQLPPSLHYDNAGPQVLGLEDNPFFVNTNLSAWNSDGHPRRAGVSAFGVGGTNAHVVLEEAPSQPVPHHDKDLQILTISARTPSALESASESMVCHLGNDATIQLADVAFTTQCGRRAFEHRRAVLCRDRDSAVQALLSQDERYCYTGLAAARPRVAFLFPGLGNEYVGMGQELYGQERAYRVAVDRCAAIIREISGESLTSQLFPDQTVQSTDSDAMNLRRMLSHDRQAPEKRFASDLVRHLASFTTGYALAELWQSYGVTPSAVLGHSLGEYVAACVAGVLSLESALRLVAQRFRIVERCTPAGSMLALGVPAETALELVSGQDVRASTVNSPKQCVVGGAPEGIRALQEQAAKLKLPHRLLESGHAFHTPLMAAATNELRAAVQSTPCKPPVIPMISNVTGRWLKESDIRDPDYWCRHLTQPVRFAEGCATLAGQAEILLELGPGQDLGTWATQAAVQTGLGSAPPTIPSLRHLNDSRSDSVVFAVASARLWVAGVNLRFSLMHEGKLRRRVPLPTYAFERRRYWIDPPSVPAPNLPLSELSGGGEATPAPALHKAAQKPAQRTPTATEQLLLGIWTQLLGIPDIGVDQSFFDLGGDSLAGMQVLSILREVGIDLALRDLFEAPYIEDLARRIDTAVPQMRPTVHPDRSEFTE